MTPPHMGTNRAYRESVRPKGKEISFQVVVEETDLQIVAEDDLNAQALAFVTEIRGILKAYIAMHPDFETSLIPVNVPDSAHPIIQDMARAASICGVGPMAAVAGGVAQYTALHLQRFSANCLIENGGDLYMCSSKPRTAAILADPSGEANIGLQFTEADFPVALCASSATIGHSLSLGHGDLVVCRSQDAFLADAAATRLCNELNTAADLTKVTDQAEAFGLDGVFAQCSGKIAAWGNMELASV